jgi:hypothetical protein
MRMNKEDKKNMFLIRFYFSDGEKVPMIVRTTEKGLTEEIDYWYRTFVQKPVMHTVISSKV